MERIAKIETKTWGGTAAETKTFNLSSLNPSTQEDLNYVTRFCLEIDMDITTLAVTGAVTARQIREWVSAINLQVAGVSVIQNMNAEQMSHLFPILAQGKPVVSDIADIGAGVANAKRSVVVYVDFASDDLVDPYMGALPAKLFNNEQLQVNTGAPAIGTDGTVNSANIKLSYKYIRLGEVLMPPIPSWEQSVGLTTYDLPPGIYAALGIQPTTVFAAANLSNIAVYANGENIITNVDPNSMLKSFDVSKGLISNPTGATDWNNDFADCVIFPLIWTEEAVLARKVRHLVDTGSGPLRTQLTGSLTSVPYIYKRFIPINDQIASMYASALGISNQPDMAWKRKTLSKSGLEEDAVSRAPGLPLIPFKLVGTYSGDTNSFGKMKRFVRNPIVVQ